MASVIVNVSFMPQAKKPIKRSTKPKQVKLARPFGLSNTYLILFGIIFAAIGGYVLWKAFAAQGVTITASDLSGTSVGTSFVSDTDNSKQPVTVVQLPSGSSNKAVFLNSSVSGGLDAGIYTVCMTGKVVSGGAGGSLTASAYSGGSTVGNPGSAVYLAPGDNKYEPINNCITNLTLTSSAAGIQITVTNTGGSTLDIQSFGVIKTAPPPSCTSGECMPTGDIPGWHQIFADDFTANVPLGSFPSAVSSKWYAYPDGWKDTSKNGTYYCSKVCSEHDGILDLYIHTENGVHMVAAPEPLLAPGSHNYGSGLAAGRYVVRAKVDPIACYKRAWLLWPDSENWPHDGEIDFPEADMTSGSVSIFQHNQNGTSGSDQQQAKYTLDQSQWHTYAFEWNPNASSGQYVSAWVDGNPLGTFTTRVPNTLMHYVLQTETSLSGCTPSDSASGHVNVDWFTVYTPT